MPPIGIVSLYHLGYSTTRADNLKNKWGIFQFSSVLHFWKIINTMHAIEFMEMHCWHFLQHSNPNDKQTICIPTVKDPDNLFPFFTSFCLFRTKTCSLFYFLFFIRYLAGINICAAMNDSARFFFSFYSLHFNSYMINFKTFDEKG